MMVPGVKGLRNEYRSMAAGVRGDGLRNGCL